MAQVINTNSLSLITQNNINKNQSAMSTAIERLSSGLRINSAKDDAAGQAIANRFTSNIKGLTQAARNANDGISAAQTTEGALSEINNNLQRVRELTVQATTGTNSESDLDSIQDEIKSRLDEIDRVSGQTTFNGVNVLAKDGSMKIQVGANDGETITIDLKKIDSSTLGLNSFNVNGKGEVANTAATTDDLKLAGYKAGTTDSSGVTAYTNEKGNAAAKASDVLAQITNGSTIDFTGTANGLDVAATTKYKYDSATKSYSFDASGVDTAKALSVINPGAGDVSKATVTIGTEKQDVNIAQDGTITAADDNAKLYLDKQGNLTKTNAGGVTEAKWDGLVSNTNQDTGAAVDTKIEVTSGAASGMKVEYAGNYASVPVSTSDIKTADGFNASVKIGSGAAQDIKVDDSGKITDTTGTAMYFKADGTLTTDANDGSGTDYDAATLGTLAANSQGSKLTVTTGTDAGKIYDNAGNGADYTAEKTLVEIKDAHISADSMAAITDGKGFTATIASVDADGNPVRDTDNNPITTAYEVAAGAGGKVTGEINGVDDTILYVGDNGAFTGTSTKTLYAQSNGAITNDTGGTIYETADGKLTTEATTASESTADPLKALDDAISQIDKFRSSLGAVQNRLDSAVTNLNNTTTNLSEAQSRIQDADYATEVSNMSKAQIIQQAGNSVLAKANQVPQQILSLLQG
ncbi:flagellin [Cedecea colo]|uniref:Flagellin n=1 Tax=Cedecea colo TaxID=2552946 RepID=A0ABX0VSU0_9ENTR|nr:flagellin [Cedecea colo]NIY49300.1 flagellin FliC [Cedecea colo]